LFETNHSGFAMASAKGGIDIAEAMKAPARALPVRTWRDKMRDWNIAPDLGDDIGSLDWFRGLATLMGLCILAFMLTPDFGPLYGAQSPMPTEEEFEEARAQMIMPRALGSDSGKRMAANENVVALTGSPERPTIELSVSMGAGDSFARVLQRAGVGGGEADKISNMVAAATPLSDIPAGTQIAIMLGARQSRTTARPLQSLTFRARFDLNISIKRDGNSLLLNRLPIAIDTTPLRIRGTIGDGLYRSARAAGAPADAIQSFLKIISGRTQLSNLRATDEFDIIMEYRRSETGEVQPGELLYAGIDRDGKPAIQMLKWSIEGNTQWFEASGVGQTTGGIGRPVNGNITSNFGMRRHPVLGYMRMHAGVDFGAPYGAPIFAVSEGIVSYAGRKGGNGNYVQITHNASLATGYSHMSRITAQPGQQVRRGQIIGYVGSTGLSTGPHLHYSLFRNGVAINPLSITFVQRAQLSGSNLADFRARLSRLKSIAPGSALGSLQKSRSDTMITP
jgi:murein DD-endopeptidase MepM/ murein hydrolase activator NlpD